MLPVPVRRTRPAGASGSGEYACKERMGYPGPTILPRARQGNCLPLPYCPQSVCPLKITHMKKLLLLTLLLSSTLAASAQYMAGKPRKKYAFPKKDDESTYVLNVTKNTDEDAEVDACVTRVAYLPYTDLLAQINELKRINSWADTTYQRRLNLLPAGGQLTVTMYRRGAKNADPGYLSLLAKNKAGEELLNLPELTAGQGRFWNRDLYMSKRTIPFVKVEGEQDVFLTINDAKTKQNFEYVIKAQ